MAKSIRALKTELRRAMNRHDLACRAHWCNASPDNGEVMEQAARRVEAARMVLNKALRAAGREKECLL